MEPPEPPAAKSCIPADVLVSVTSAERVCTRVVLRWMNDKDACALLAPGWVLSAHIALPFKYAFIPVGGPVRVLGNRLEVPSVC